jgi:hypothetical protein
MRWAGHVAHMGEKRNVYKVSMGKPEGKRPLGKPRHRWEDGTRMDLKEIGWGSVDWIQLAQDRDRWQAFVNTVMNLRVLAPHSYKILKNALTGTCNIQNWLTYIIPNLLLTCNYIYHNRAQR